MTAKQRLTLARVLAFILVITISVATFLFRDQARQLAQFGYPGIFLLSFISNATVILPAPGILFVSIFGAVFQPFWVAIAAGAGAALGEMVGYMIGFSGQGLAERSENYLRLLDWMTNHRPLINLVIMALAFIPNPFFDLAGIAAGTLKIPIPTFLIFTFIGKTLKMLLFAYAGASSLNWLFGE